MHRKQQQNTNPKTILSLFPSKPRQYWDQQDHNPWEHHFPLTTIITWTTVPLLQPNYYLPFTLLKKKLAGWPEQPCSHMSNFNERTAITQNQLRKIKTKCQIPFQAWRIMNKICKRKKWKHGQVNISKIQRVVPKPPKIPQQRRLLFTYPTHHADLS